MTGDSMEHGASGENLLGTAAEGIAGYSSGEGVGRLEDVVGGVHSALSTKLDHVNLTAESIDESIVFYESLFGFENVESGVRPDGRKWVVLASGDSMICLTECRGRTAPPAFNSVHQINHFGLRILDCLAWEQKIIAHKIALQYDGPVAYPRSTSWYINDPTGHEIEVSFTGGGPLQF